MKDVIKIKKPNQVSNVKVSHEASSLYADLSKQWAIKLDKPIENGEYSSKYYAKISEQNADSANKSAKSAEEAASNLKKFITNSLYFPELKISNEDIVLNKLKLQKRSTFDKSKFTVVGSPTITDDGVASGFSANNYLNTGFKESNSNSSWEINCVFTLKSKSGYAYTGLTERHAPQLGVSATSMYVELPTSTTTGWYSSVTNFNVQLDTLYYTKAIYKDSTLQFFVSQDGKNYTSGNKKVIPEYVWTDYLKIGSRGNSGLNGSIDLKAFSITVDGKEVFCGNKTGVDTIKIGNKYVEIPYTQSKTGSKIVDGVYRDRVQDLYEQCGYTHYYTLGDTDFTLATCKGSDVVESGENYEQTADLTLKQWGSATSGQTVNLLPYKDTNYAVTLASGNKTKSSFVANATGDYFAVGKTVLG